jgi:hypothetical protein
MVVPNGFSSFSSSQLLQFEVMLCYCSSFPFHIVML